jgi:hypothetical protein
MNSELTESDPISDSLQKKVSLEDAVTILIVEVGGRPFKVFGSEKVCPTCGETKPIDDFTVNARATDGHHWECRVCKSRRDSKSYERHRQKRIEMSKRYREEHPDKHRKYSRDYKRRKRLEEREKRIRELGLKPW